MADKKNVGISVCGIDNTSSDTDSYPSDLPPPYTMLRNPVQPSAPPAISAPIQNTLSKLELEQIANAHKPSIDAINSFVSSGEITPDDAKELIKQQIQNTIRRLYGEFADLHNINPALGAMLSIYEPGSINIHIVVDDSGSMKSFVNIPNGRGGYIYTQRYLECKDSILIVYKLFQILGCEKDITIRFLNRGIIIFTPEEQKNKPLAYTRLEHELSKCPEGFTPLVKNLTDIYNEIPENPTKKTVVLAFLDGEESDGGFNRGYTKDICRKLEQRNAYITIVLCTDEDDIVELWNKIDALFDFLDVVDDYHSEVKEIMKAQGQSFRFSFGDYIVKILVGCLNKSLDSIDEVKLNLDVLAKIFLQKHQIGESHQLVPDYVKSNLDVINLPDGFVYDPKEEAKKEEAKKEQFLVANQRRQEIAEAQNIANLEQVRLATELSNLRQKQELDNLKAKQLKDEKRRKSCWWRMCH